VLRRGGNLSVATGLIISAIIPHGLKLKIEQGRGSNQEGGHSQCLHAKVPRGQVRVERGPLAALEKRLFGSANSGQIGPGGQRLIRRSQVVFDHSHLQSDRLSWFMRAATGSTHVTLSEAECVSRRDVRAAAPSPPIAQQNDDRDAQRLQHRTLECVGLSAVFGDGAGALLSVAFFEVSHLVAAVDAGGTARNVTQVHMTLLKIHTNLSSGQPLQPLEFAAPLTDLPTTSWLRHLQFPGDLHRASVSDDDRPFFALQASSAEFALRLEQSLLLQHTHLPTHSDFKQLQNPLLTLVHFGGSDSAGRFLYLPGFAISTTHVGLSSDSATGSVPAASFLGGLDRLFPKVAFSRSLVSLHLDGFLAIQGCLWPSTEDMMFVMDLDDALVFSQPSLIAATSRATVQLSGVGTPPHYSAVLQPLHLTLNEDSRRNVTLQVLLSSIRQQNTAAATTAAAGGGAASRGEGGEVYEMTGSIEIQHWGHVLGRRWLQLRKTLLTLDLEIVVGSLALSVGAVTASGEGDMTITYDSLTPRTHPTPRINVSVPVNVSGTSSSHFPHFMLLLSSALPPLAGPAGLVRTLSQDPTHLSVNHVSCGTSAVRDLTSPRDSATAGRGGGSEGPFTVTLSTWDATEYEHIRYDPREYNGVVKRRAPSDTKSGGGGGGGVGTAQSGSACVFPFRYKGQLYTSCTSHDWSAPWYTLPPRRCCISLWGHRLERMDAYNRCRHIHTQTKHECVSFPFVCECWLI